ATPLSLAPGENIGFTVAFTPTGAPGVEAATIRIITNDPGAPVVDLLATGSRGTARLAMAIAHAGEFGPVCLGSIKDEALTLSNSGQCTLSVTGISSPSGEFVVPEVLSYPLMIEPGNALEVPIRFQPTSLGAKTATITVTSDDPANPHTIEVSG